MNDDTSPADLPDWLYFKLYVGQAAEKLDSLLLDLLPQVLLDHRIGRWFFLRYIDEHGVHLRLRVKAGDPLGALGLREALEGLCERSLQRIPDLAASDYRPMALPVGFAPGPKPATAIVRLERASYEPELDKFGGAAGMPIAEETFEVSSQAALGVLLDEAAGRYSRKTIAPCLMKRVAEAFLPPEREAAFWRHYSYYWLGGSTPAAEDWRLRFFDKGRELHERRIAVVAAASDLRREAMGWREAWGRQLERAAEAYRLRDGAETSPDVLALNFAHLMNNRLGLIALEEAYLAALLEQSANARRAA